MTGKMTPSAFNKVIEQDIEWLESKISESDKSSFLEFDHIINVLRYAAKQYNNNGKRIDELDSHVCGVSLDFTGKCMICEKQITNM